MSSPWARPGTDNGPAPAAALLPTPVVPPTFVPMPMPGPAPAAGPPPTYGWVPLYRFDPYYGWLPQWTWDPARGWVHTFIWAPLPSGWSGGAPAATPRRTRHPHAAPTSYLRLLRTPTYGWWKPLVGLLLAGTVWLLASVVLVVGALVVRREDIDGFLDQLAADPLGTPSTLLITNLNLALLIPSVWLAVLVVHQERLGWLSSVLRRLRWRLLLFFAGVAAVVLSVGLTVASLLVPSAAGGANGSFDRGYVVGTLLVVLLTTPLQAAAEEYLFRGYLSQAIASWIRPRIAGALVAGVLTGLLFALAHGSQDLPTFLSRLAFGLTGSLVVHLTGGLEAAIAYHTMNNVLLFLLLLAVGPELDVEVSGGLLLAVDVTLMAVYVAVVRWWSRRTGVARVTVDPDRVQAGLGPAVHLG